MGRPKGRAGAYISSRARHVVRFLTYVGLCGGGACWPWLGGYQCGVPFIRAENVDHVSPARFAWELFNGPIPAGTYAKCRHGNAGCCRPDHLELRTLGRPRRG